MTERATRPPSATARQVRFQIKEARTGRFQIKEGKLIAGFEKLLKPVLRAHGLHIDPAGLANAVATAVAELPGQLPSPAPARELSESEAAALRRGGFTLDAAAPRDRDVLAETAAEHAALLETALTVGEAAGLLGIDASRVRHLLAARRLFGVKLGHAWRLPRFQLDEGRLVPGLGTVLEAIPAGVHPVDVARWFATPQPELELGGTTLPPRSWLLSGGPPEILVPLVRDLGSF